MKRRLTSAYDHMTMPESCSQSIEKKLEESMKQQRAGRYTRVMPPTAPRRSGWAAAVAAVCLMLVLSVGGSALLLRGLPRMEHRPVETVATVLPYAGETPPDHYKEVTNRPVKEVENFAQIVRSCMLTNNWDALRNKVSLPATVQETKVSEWGYFVEWMEILAMNPLLTDRMEQETCRAMFCNWQGISMARGLIWLNEVNGELKITAVNVEIQEEPEVPQTGKQVPEVFAEILSGDRIKMAGIVDKLPVEEYCANWRADVKLDSFAVVDMDSDGICELVISLTSAQDEQAGYMVLREDGREVCAYPFRASELMDLKKDGGFFRRDRDHRVYFDGKTHWHTEEVQEQREKPLAQWHSWPCQSPELLLKSYEHVTGTGWSVFPGHPYYLFEGLAMERAGNAMDVLEYWMKSAVCVQEENSVYIFDPDAPGTAFYGTLTEEAGFSQFSQVGYYISTEEREYQAEIRNMLSEEPEYWADVHLPSFMGTFGRMVSTPEELAAYFGYTPMPDAETMQQTREIKALMDEITSAYLTGGSEAMEPYLAETYQNREKKFFPKDAVIRLKTYSALPERVMEVGETLYVSTGIRLAGDDRDYSFNLELVKQKNGWKVEAYHLYISED